ncbi:MAG: transglycosylase domain-containing protein [Bacteroidota bacterium]
MGKNLGRIVAVMLILGSMASSVVVVLASWAMLSVPPTWQVALHYGKPVCRMDGTMLAEATPGVPPYLRSAFIAAEDANFYDRPITTPFAVLAAVVHKRIPPRPSPFTTGVVGCLLSSQGDFAGRPLERQIKGIVWAFMVEAMMPKDLVLDSYLEVASLGRGISGIGAASSAYFDKTPAALTIAEAAYLAGLAKSPGLFAEDDKRGLERRDWVLARMEQTGAISQRQYRAAVAEPLGRRPVGN